VYTFANYNYYPVVRDGYVAFQAVGGPMIEYKPHHFEANLGIYVDDAGDLQKVADKWTPIPEGSGNFQNFGLGDPLSAWYHTRCLSVQNGRVVFKGTGTDEEGLADQEGLYTDRVNGILSKIVDLGDSELLWSGKTLKSLYIGPEGLDGYQIAFRAVFTDVSEGIYVATITPLVGDLNNDDVVDLLDFGIFRSHYGETGPSIADLNGDEAVDLLDFGIFRSHCGDSCP
jgi:hypothetical protein